MRAVATGLFAVALLGVGVGAGHDRTNDSGGGMVMITEPMTWSEARGACMDRGLDLALLDVPDHALMAVSVWQDTVTEPHLERALDASGPWVGLTNKGGAWRWLDGAPLGTAAEWDRAPIPPSASSPSLCAHLSSFSASVPTEPKTKWGAEACKVKRPFVCGPSAGYPALLSRGRNCPRGTFSPDTLTECASLAASQGFNMQLSAQQDCQEEPCLVPDVGLVRGDPACFLDETVNGTRLVYVPPEYSNYLQSCSSCEEGPDVHLNARALCADERDQTTGFGRVPPHILPSPSPSSGDAYHDSKGNRTLALVMACLVFGSALAVIGIVVRKACSKWLLTKIDGWCGQSGVAVEDGVHTSRVSRVFDLPVPVVTCEAVTTTPAQETQRPAVSTIIPVQQAQQPAAAGENQ